jgi:hypothetical protein
MFVVGYSYNELFLFTGYKEKRKVSSLSFEITADDVALVLKQHGVPPTQDLVDWVFDDLNRITAVASLQADLSNQVEAALSEIENILLENRIVNSPKKFIG